MKITSINKSILLVCILLMVSGVVLSWPNGAPESTCVTLLPHHGISQPLAAASSPFVLSQSKTEYDANERVTVTVNATNGLLFKGFIIQAYDPTTSKVIGKFQSGPGIKTLDSCSAITHSEPSRKKSATLVWNAPATGSGSVGFKATIVQHFSEYYPNIVAKVK